MIRGRFIVFEGVDGSGKSTVARLTYDRLQAEGKDCVLTAEPSGSWLGDVVRKANRSGTDDLAEALLFLADRAEHTKEMRDMVEQGKWVVCDRYYASTLAYQTALLKDRLEDPMTWLLNINLPIIERPDVTFFFAIRPEVALERLNGRGDLTKFEKLDFLREVDENYRKVEQMDDSFFNIDAERPLDDVLETVLQRLRQNL
jgi:dTMP kinase